MTKIGYAAMMEQFHPTDLLDWCAQAEKTGFEAGFMVSSTSIRGRRSRARAGSPGLHGCPRPADVVAVRDRRDLSGLPLPPGRHRPRRRDARRDVPRPLLSGSRRGEALNEHVIAPVWPEVPIRSAMMFEAIEVISKLFTGEVVRHGKYTLERAKLYTRPADDQKVPIYVATAGPVNAKKTGRFADGLITVGAADEKMERIWGKFEEGRAEAGKPAGGPKFLQIHISWARTDEEAMQNALVEWPNGGMAFFPKQDIKNPEDFDGIAKLVRPEDFKNRAIISSDLDEHAATSSTTWIWGTTRSISTTSVATRPSSSRSSARRSCPTSSSTRSDRTPRQPATRRRARAAR